MRATRICLVRHGETDWNRERRLQGSEDIPLNATGRLQASALAEVLAERHFDAIYSSDLVRAADTARAVATRLGVPLVLLPALQERHFGIFQGLTRSEAEQRYPEMQRRIFSREPDFVPPEGESLRQCYERISVTLRELALRHAGETILLVAHGGVLDAARRFVTGMALDLPRDFELGNAALNWLVCTEGGWSLETWNENGHLLTSRDDLRL